MTIITNTGDDDGILILLDVAEKKKTPLLESNACSNRTRARQKDRQMQMNQSGMILPIQKTSQQIRTSLTNEIRWRFKVCPAANIQS